MMVRSILFAVMTVALAACNAGDPPADEDRAAASPAADTVVVPTTPVQDPQPPQRMPATATNGEISMECDASKAEWMVGQDPTDELLQRGAADAGARVARYIRHDEMVTMEYHPSRLNVDLDEQGKISAVRCG